MSAHGLINDPKRSEMNFILRAADPTAKSGTGDTRAPGVSALNIQGMSLVKPPYGRIALDLDRGERSGRLRTARRRISSGITRR